MFDRIDIFACPSMPQASVPASAMPTDARSLGVENEETIDRFTIPFNLSRNPTVSLPCGESPSGPPPSLQLVGRLRARRSGLRAGRAFVRATDWHNQRPPLGKAESIGRTASVK